MRYTTTLFIAILCLAAMGTKAQTKATFFTTMGNFVVTFEDTKTPRTVDSMLSRINSKFYDGLIFHRVIKNFMIQGGDPNGNGTGGPGYTIPDEFDASLKNVPGTIAMANSGPNTNGSQFFINVVTNSHLNNKHTVFGSVTIGYDVVENISKVATGANDKPVTDVKMDSVRVGDFVTNIEQTTAVAQNFSVFPNPTTGLFTLLLHQPNLTNYILVSNIKGQVIYQTEVSHTNATTVDLHQEAMGIYMVQITNAKGTYRSKVLVQ